MRRLFVGEFRHVSIALISRPFPQNLDGSCCLGVMLEAPLRLATASFDHHTRAILVRVDIWLLIRCSEPKQVIYLCFVNWI
jgi:hypothetical protein